MCMCIDVRVPCEVTLASTANNDKAAAAAGVCGEVERKLGVGGVTCQSLN